MKNKHDFIKRLHDDEKYKRALENVKTEEERQKIKNIVDAFVGGFADILAPMIEKVQSDHEFAQQLGRALKDRQSVLTTEPMKSGSTG